MKKQTRQRPKNDELRSEYDLAQLKGRVRGKYAESFASGYSVIIHHPNGTKTVQKFQPPRGSVVLDPDMLPYFPDSQAVNQALRALVRIADRKVKKAA